MPNRSRTLGLLAALVVLCSALIWTVYPHEPRLVFTNFGDEPESISATYGGRKVEFGSVAARTSVTLPFELVGGRPVTINGVMIPAEELDRLTGITRRERRDIQLGVDFHGCLKVEGTEMHPLFSGFRSGATEPDE